jgi:hypothetical protein|uniref:Uncharacterized protein n=1 Tax=Bionectria ochroleuca TaxID=29856 RepID=A0A8H7NLB4_BIOOC
MSATQRLGAFLGLNGVGRHDTIIYHESATYQSLKAMESMVYGGGVLTDAFPSLYGSVG